MTLILALIVIAVLLVFGLWLKQRWETQDDAQAPTSAGPAGSVAEMADLVRTRAQSLANGWGGAQTRVSPAQFRAWAAQAFAGDTRIQQWLSALSDDQIDALTTHLDDFCRNMGFELAWLVEARMTGMDDVADELAQIARLYIRAGFQAVAVQDKVELFRLRLALVESPASRAHRELRERLFGILVEAGLSDVTISDHMAASSRTRQEQITATIQRAAVEHPDVLHAALQTILTDRAAEMNGAAGAAHRPVADGAATGVAANGANVVSTPA